MISQRNFAVNDLGIQITFPVIVLENVTRKSHLGTQSTKGRSLVAKFELIQPRILNLFYR